MHKELIRLSTFADWQRNAKVSPLQLARNGFFYSCSSDESICFSCGFRISSWNEQQDPQEQHRHLSPNCPLITGTETRNIPLTGTRTFTSEPPPPPSPEASERLIDVSSNSLNNVFHSALNRANAKELFTSGPNSTSRIVDRNHPDFIQLRHETVRLGTFHDWPSTALASPWALAREGFFYTGKEDRVQCAFCRGFLKNWQLKDCPPQEHSKHYPSCPLVRGLDVGNVPADGRSAVGATMTHRSTAGDQRSLERSEGFNLVTGEPSQTSIQAQASRAMDQAVHRSNENVDEEIDLEARMSVVAVRAVLDMGFARDMVKRTIENKLSTTGTDFSDAESLLDALFLAGETTNFHNDGSASAAAEAAVAPASSASSHAAAIRHPSSSITSSNSTVSTLSTSTLTSQSVDVIGTTATTSNAVTGFASLLSTHSWKDSGIFSFASSSPSLPTICSGFQLPMANSSSSSLSSSLAAASVPSESQALAPVRPVASSASAAATMATIPEVVGTGSPTTKLKAKRKRNKKKTPSPSNREPEQDPQSNGKTGEEAAGKEEEREPEAEGDNESLKYLEENRQLREARTCKVCMDSEVNTVFLPCGHLVCCNNCSPQLRNCPICRTFIRGTVKTSLS